MTQVLLALILMVQIALWLRPAGPVARAQADGEARFYMEPGIATITTPDNDARFFGKIVVDWKTGNVWGFPSLTRELYPRDPTRNDPPVSNPVYLGRYNLDPVWKRR